LATVTYIRKEFGPSNILHVYPWPLELSARL